MTSLKCYYFYYARALLRNGSNANDKSTDATAKENHLMNELNVFIQQLFGINNILV